MIGDLDLSAFKRRCEELRTRRVHRAELELTLSFSQLSLSQRPYKTRSTFPGLATRFQICKPLPTVSSRPRSTLTDLTPR